MCRLAMLTIFLLLTVSLSWAQAPAGPYPLLPESAAVGVIASHAAPPTYAPTKATDGSAATLWHTTYTTKPLPPPPYWLMLDLGTPHWLDGLDYLPRQDASANGTIAEYAIDVSLDGLTWTSAAQGTFMPAGKTARTVRFPAIQGRYARLTALREAQNLSYASAAEVRVYGLAMPLGAPGPPTGLTLTFE